MKNVLTIPHLAEKKNNKNLPSAVQAWKGLEQTEISKFQFITYLHQYNSVFAIIQSKTKPLLGTTNKA